MGKKVAELKKEGNNEAAKALYERMVKVKKMHMRHAEHAAKRPEAKKPETKKTDRASEKAKGCPDCAKSGTTCPKCTAAKNGATAKGCPGCAKAKASGGACPKCASAKKGAASKGCPGCAKAKVSGGACPKCAAAKCAAAKKDATAKGCPGCAKAKAAGKPCPKCVSGKAQAGRGDNDKRGDRAGGHHRGGEHGARWEEMRKRFEAARRQHAEGGDRGDRWAEMRKRIEAARSRMGGDRGRSDHRHFGRGGSPSHGRGDARAPDGDSKEAHLRQALMHLRAAGMNEIAEKLGAHFRNMGEGKSSGRPNSRQQRGRSQAPSSTNQRLGHAVGELRKDVEQLQRQLAELKAGIARAHQAHGVQPKRPAPKTERLRPDADKMREMRESRRAEMKKRAESAKKQQSKKDEHKKSESKKGGDKKKPVLIFV
jgi:hypothetical protein